MVFFSVVTVVLNDLEGLRRTHSSLAAQSCQNFEWIVRDGGSDHKTTDFLSSLGRSVKWESKKDNGIYHAMNLGASMGVGGYVLFMNAGDTFFDGDTLTVVSRHLLNASHTVDILFGGATLLFPRSGRAIYRPPRLSEQSLWHGLPANHQATYYRRSLLNKTPYNLDYSLCGDYYLAAVLMREGARAAYLDESLAVFEVGGQSYSRLRQLFVEPYRIQRDVLGTPLHYRLASALKRLVSTLGFIVLSQPFSRNK